MPPPSQLETDVIQRFEMALSARMTLVRGDLVDGLLAASARYALVEFKAGAECIASADDKPLRHKLCRALGSCRHSAALARDIHYLAWDAQTVEDIVVAPYAGTVCPLLDEDFRAPAKAAEPVNRFIRRFLGSRTAGGSARRFKAYVEVLNAIAEGLAARESQRFEGAVYVFVPDASSGPTLHSVRFRGLDHLRELAVGRSPALPG